MSSTGRIVHRASADRRTVAIRALALGILAWLSGCGKPAEPPPSQAAAKTNGSETPADAPRLQREPWGEVDGKEIVQYHLSNANHVQVSLINLGATITAVRVPGRDEKVEIVTLSFPSLEQYQTNAPYMGSICGRYANRIAAGKFRIGDEEFTLATNNKENHLHGGKVGFSHVVWHAEAVEDAGDGSPAVKFTYSSPDGEEGYPGTLKATVTYTLTDANELKIDYTAQTDKPTVLNLTNHAYWNLAGAGSGTVGDHVLTLFCDQYLPVDGGLIPTGELKSVEGTPMDFRKPTAIGARIADVEGGYDHCYVINGEGKELKPVAKVTEPTSGRVMTVFSTEPGVQLYTGNFLNGEESNGGFPKHGGFCLECQHFPDSPNRPEFPTTALNPGEVYTQTTVYKFSVQ